MSDVARTGGRRVNAHWQRELLDIDPAEHLARLTASAMSVTTDMNVRVDPGDLGTIAAVVVGSSEAPRYSPHPPAPTRRGHALRPVPTASSPSTHRLELLALVAEWVDRRKPC